MRIADPAKLMSGLSVSRRAFGGTTPWWEHEGRLDQSCDPSRRLEMSDVCLRRPDQAHLALPKDGAERVDLDRVAERRSCSVRFDVTDLSWRDPRTLERAADHCLLRRAVRGRQPVGPAVLVDRRAPHHRPHPVPGRHRVREALQHHHPAPLAPPVPVGRRVERFAPAVRGHHIRLRERQCQLRRQDEVDPSRQRQVAVARFDSPARVVDRHERRRARGVDGPARAVEIEKV